MFVFCFILLLLNFIYLFIHKWWLCYFDFSRHGKNDIRAIAKMIWKWVGMFDFLFDFGGILFVNLFCLFFDVGSIFSI